MSELDAAVSNAEDGIRWHEPSGLWMTRDTRKVCMFAAQYMQLSDEDKDRVSHATFAEKPDGSYLLSGDVLAQALEKDGLMKLTNSSIHSHRHRRCRTCALNNITPPKG